MYRFCKTVQQHFTFFNNFESKTISTNEIVQLVSGVFFKFKYCKQNRLEIAFSQREFDYQSKKNIKPKCKCFMYIQL